MTGILAGLRIVEGSAFIAAPMAGMTLAQLGADVIRFDDLKGGLDSDRWPVTKDGQSIYWAGLNKGKRSIAVDLRSPKGRELLTALITAPGEGGGIFSTNMPARGWLSYEELSKKRADLIALNIVGDRHGAAQRRLHGELDHRLPAGHRTGRPSGPGQQRAAGVGHRHRLCRRDVDPGGRAASPADRQGPAHRAAAAGHGVGRGVGDRLHRRGGDQRGRPAALRQRDLRHLRPRLPHQGRPLRDDLHLLRSSPRGAGQGRRLRRRLRRDREGQGRRPQARGRPLERARRDRRRPRAMGGGPERGRRGGGAEEGGRAVGAVPELPRAQPGQGRGARQSDVHRPRPARHRQLSGRGHAGAVRRRAARAAGARAVARPAYGRDPVGYPRPAGARDRPGLHDEKVVGGAHRR